MTEYEQLAREAEKYKGWYRDGEKDAIISLDGNWIFRYYDIDQAQFILDAICLLPQMVRELQEAKAFVEASKHIYTDATPMYNWIIEEMREQP